MPISPPRDGQSSRSFSTPQVVLLLELLEHDAGEQLREREVVSAVLGAVLPEGVLAQVIRRRQHPPW
jgi:hypothetical protein